MARRVSDYRIRRIADRGNEEDGPDSRARGDRFYRNRRSADRGNEKVDRDPGIIYDYPPAYDEYEDEEWYSWMTGAGVTYDPTGYSKTADKRILLLTNEDDPFGSIKGITKLAMTRTTLQRVKEVNDDFVTFIFLMTCEERKGDEALDTAKEVLIDGQIRGIYHVFDPGGWFLKLSKLEDEFFSKRRRMMRIDMDQFELKPC